MNRAQLRQLAEDRILDAERLLTGGRWSGAFQDKRFSEKCWTHDLEDLLALANLKPTLDADAAANAALFTNWATAKDWKETSRYEQKTQAQAQAMYDAIANNPNGVLAWIRIRW